VIRTVRNLWRLAAIAVTLARHDALAPLEALGVAPWLVWMVRRAARREARDLRIGERLAQAAVALGPAFIKLGQALSTRADLLGVAVAEDLAMLRDRLPPFPAEAARAVIARELGMPVAQAFSAFDDRPVAAASIAQVHFATTAGGREVAVKVLRPGIERAFQRDLDLMLWLARLIERTQPRWRRLRPVDSVRAFAEMVAIEMNLRLEGAAAAELGANFADDPTFNVPAVDWQRTARRVLTTERVSGIAIDQRDALIAAGHDPAALLECAARATFRQIFRDGFFHGDPHQGNLFVDSDGNLWVVDFGIMGRLDVATRRFLAEMLLGFLNADYTAVADVHFRAGYVPAERQRGAFVQALRAITEPILGLPANRISVGRLLGHLFEVTETFGMQTQPHLLLLQKVMVVAEGVGRVLYPEANMWQLARPLIEDWMVENTGPEARVRAAAEGALEAARSLPRIAAKAERALDHVAANPAPGPPAPGARRGLTVALAFALGLGAGVALALALAD
jgi:ubiquinone biosynthesis protein